MNAVFTKVLDMSLTASFVILAVLAVRFLLQKAPKAISYALWAVVLFRLLCPVSLTGPVSLLAVTRPSVTENPVGTSRVSYLPENLTARSAPQVPSGMQPIQSEAVPAARENADQPAVWNWLSVASWVWGLGAAGMIAHSVWSCHRLRRGIGAALQLEENIFLADGIPTPFVMGIFKPGIYLPSNTPMEEQRYILAHERHHIRRGDHIFKLLAYAALCVHWFNPLVWAAFFLANQDMEMSCDEAVIRKLGPEIRADYAQTLVNMASSRSVIAGMPLAFGEGDTKSRVINMAKWKQPKTWVIFVSVLVTAIVLVSCAVNPGEGEPTSEVPLSTEMTEPVSTVETRTESVNIGLKIPVDIRDVENGNEIWFCSVDYKNEKISETPWGGVKTYPAPADSWSASSMDDWLRELGVPQIVDGLHDYMAGSNPDGNLEVSFADAGGRETMHYFYPQGDTVFELWFDTAALDDMTRAAILESVHFAPDARIERGLPMVQTGFTDELVAAAQKDEEAYYLEKCKSVLESLQKEASYAVKILRSNYGDVFLNDTSTAVYYKNGGDWLLIHKIPEEGFVHGVNQFGYMTVDGQHYNNEGQGMDEKEEVNWVSAPFDDSVLPWIAAFDWNAQEVLYVSKIPAGKGLCFTLQVMAPYHTDLPDAYPYYQMQFIFNENGAFDRIENTFYFHHDQEGDYSAKETIQFIEDSPENAIAYEHQRYRNAQ